MKRAGKASGSCIDPGRIFGRIPYRLALAGGWIDQPFVSRLNPHPPGSMVVVSLEPMFRFMDRSGMATSTREIALKLWTGPLPDRPAAELARELYAAENRGKADPSGSQDMIGLIYPGINRLDYDFDFQGGVFPRHIESNRDPQVARWFENVLQVLPVLVYVDEARSHHQSLCIEDRAPFERRLRHRLHFTIRDAHLEDGVHAGFRIHHPSVPDDRVVHRLPSRPAAIQKEW